MTVTVRLFASYAESLGRSEIELDVEPGTTVEQVVRAVSSLSGGSRLPRSPLVAVNLVYATHQTIVTNGDEIAIIPPVAGG